MKRWIAAVVLLVARCALAESVMGSDRLVQSIDGGTLAVTVVAPDIVHVQYVKDAAALRRPSFSVVEQPPLPGDGASGWLTAFQGRASYALATRNLTAMVDIKTGQVTFLDRDGKVIVAEAGGTGGSAGAGGRSLEPAEVQGEKTFHVRQQWIGDPAEGLYGLGQHQFGLVNLRGYDIDLWQHNTEIAVPFLLSSKGYGIFWDNPSYTKFGDTREFAPIPPDHLLDANGGAGGLTATSFRDTALTRPIGTRVDPVVDISPAPQPGERPARNPEQGVRWEGQVVADAAGDYQFQLYANGGIKLWIDGNLVADHWRQNWLPWNELARVHFDAGTNHTLKLEWSKDQGTYCQLRWKPPAPGASAPPNTSLWSQVGDGIDYYLIYGPAPRDVLASYRRLTGRAPMMPKWAFGLWQSRQRYKTQQESLQVVQGYRERKIPFDTIVQDWFYWKENAWGSHQFDPERFPDPDRWIRDIHDQHARLMISVWGKFYPGTDNFEAMHSKGYLYQPNLDEHIVDWVGKGYVYTFYDAFNADARQLFWQQVRDRLFTRGVDAWWMDATEPDLMPSPPMLDRQLAHMPRTALGTGARVLNAYPLCNSRGVYEGQRAAAPDQRVFILTRSGYAGQQRYAAVVWSGDITSSWTAMKKQIAAGVGASVSGLPYWTMDAGGFAVPGRWSTKNPTPEALDEWRELNARWFEFAAFVPLTRLHGEAPDRELWEFGGASSDAGRAMLKFDRLRYRLLPYIYSLAGAVTHDNSTFMLPLAVDDPQDATARSIDDEYLFGPAFLVSPVTTYQARTRPVYLPGKSAETWYDFWTGAPLAGGRQIEAPAPYDAMPLHVRAGSIVPIGPELQYTLDKPADPLTLWVYTGANGRFTLYEDDGLTNAYTKGAFSRIPLAWDEATQTLTLGKREGTYEGMLKERTIQVVFVSPEHARGFSFDPGVDRQVRYTGEKMEVRR